MNLKKLTYGRVEDGKGALLKPIIKAGIKKVSKSLAKNATKNAAKGTAKAAGKEATKGATKKAAEGALSKYFSKLSDLLDNVDPEDFLKAEKLAKNLKSIYKVLSKNEDVSDEEAEDIADMIIESEDDSEDILSEDDSNTFKKILEKLFKD